VGVFVFAGSADALLFSTDFSNPPFVPGGANTKLWTTAYGELEFTGKIGTSMGGTSIGDHTSGSGQFWYSSLAYYNPITLVANHPDFHANYVEFWAHGAPGAGSNITIDFIDRDGLTVFTVSPFLSGADWEFFSFNLSGMAFADMVLTANDRQFAIDDFALNGVPEPLTVTLLGTGFFGLVGLRRKKKVS